MKKLFLKKESLWRVLFWLGFVTIIIGTGLGTEYVNNVVQGQTYLIVGFAVIVLGIALIATGVFVSRARSTCVKRTLM